MTNASTNIINNKDYGSIINRTEEEITPSPILNSNTFLSGNRISFEFLNDADNGSSSIPTWKEHTMRDSTVIEAILNSVNYFVGIGVLSIPYALKSGWICVVNMIVLGIVFGITGELIGLCQQKLNCKTYPDIAEVLLN